MAKNETNKIVIAYIERDTIIYISSSKVSRFFESHDYGDKASSGDYALMQVESSTSLELESDIISDEIFVGV